MTDNRLPVTVLSSFLRAGKSHLLNSVLKNREGCRVAVIVIDMSEVNIEADLVRADTELSQTDDTSFEMPNGCICCAMRVNLLDEVRRLSAERQFDCLLIEPYRVSEPLPVAASFDFRDETGDSLSNVARLDTMVTVVDAVNLLNDFSSHDFLRDLHEVMGEEDERTMVHLLTDQIEFADIVIRNKVPGATPDQVGAARKVIRCLNADVEIIETDHSQIVAVKIPDTRIFESDKVHEHPMWAKELYGFLDHMPETEKYGFTCYVYWAQQPFIPKKILATLNGDMPGVIRTKGHFWIATRPEWVTKFSLVGLLSSVQLFATWWAPVPKGRWPDHASTGNYIQSHWQETWGDLHQELVFIGADINWAALKAKLDACLVPTELAAGLSALPLDMPTPFPGRLQMEDAA